MKILLVDDDEILVAQLTADLTAQNYVVDTTTDGLLGWQYAAATTYDLIVLDINLPRLDGLSLCQRLRQTGYSGAILLLTAQSSSTDKVMGLDAGADDYLVKPYTPIELIARMRALLRRPHLVDGPTLEWGSLQLNSNTGQVKVNDYSLSLSPKEYGLLELFLRHPQRIFSNTMLLERLWSLEEAPGEETIRTHIKRLRRKLKQAGADDMIENVYGMGYRLKSQPSAIAVDQITAARTAALDSFKRFMPLLNTRLDALKQAASALEQGQLSPDVQKPALAAAHKLAGSLGLFGLEAGSHLAYLLEEWLQRPHIPEGETFCALVEQLQQLLQAPQLAPPSSGDRTLELISQSALAPLNQPANLADINWLTGLVNRHRATIELELLLKLAQRGGQPVSLLLLRLMPQASDNHEILNQYLLQTLSQKLPAILYSGDVLARWDHSELLIGLWDTDLPQAQERLWQTLRLLLADSLGLALGPQIQAELQLGAAAFPAHGKTVQSLYQHTTSHLEALPLGNPKSPHCPC
jgi:DNA-binding response OmpR family regulator/GGDEF domain-containing protein